MKKGKTVGSWQIKREKSQKAKETKGNYMKKLLLLAFTCLIVISACKTKKETTSTEVVVVKPALDCSTKGLTYSSIKPIMDQHCTSCHSYGGSGGFNFENITDVKRAAEKGELLGTIKHERGFPDMPAQAEKLDQASIDLIECWIKNGMKE